MQDRNSKTLMHKGKSLLPRPVPEYSCSDIGKEKDRKRIGKIENDERGI